MNTETVQGHFIEHDEFMRSLDSRKAGDFSFSETPDGLYMWLYIPGDSWMHGLPLRPTKEKRPSWQWNGNKEHPTLSPSVLAYGGDGKPLWHGFIRAGRFESC